MPRGRKRANPSTLTEQVNQSAAPLASSRRRSARFSTDAVTSTAETTGSATNISPQANSSSLSRPLSSWTGEELMEVIRTEIQRASQSHTTSTSIPQPQSHLPPTLLPPYLPQSLPPQPPAPLPSHLGTMPPPTSITSVPISAPQSVPTTASQSIQVSSSVLPGTFPASSPIQTAYPPASVLDPLIPIPAMAPNLTRPGMILSPSSDPIPHTLVQRIQSGQFVEMRDMLADNIALLSQLSSLSGIVPLPQNTISRTRLREVPSLVSWLYCFNAYVAVRTTDPTARQMLAYSRLLIREALRHGGSGWLEYDRVFRRQLSIDSSMSWNTLQGSLLAATVMGQQDQTSSGSFCSLCRECDHTSSSCALAPLQQPVYTSRQTPRPSRRQEMPVCVNWNKGRCKRGLSCNYRHVCATCQLDHKAKDCADTPNDSEYKIVPTSASTSAVGSRRQ